MLQWTWECKHLHVGVILFPLSMFPEGGLLDQIIVLFLVSLGASLLFSVMVASVYIPINIVKASLSLPHSLVISYFFDNSYPNGWGLSHYSFDVLSLIISEVRHLFLYVSLAILMSSLEKGLVFYPLFNWVIYFFAVEYVSSL